MQRFSIPSLGFFELVIAPAFQDLAPDAQGFNGTLNEFTLMPNVTSSRKIIDIRRAQNIMQRRDASCDVVYKNLFGTSNRKVTVEELISAIKFCRNEFYQGCLKDFRNNDPVFEQKIVPYFRKAVNIDLTTNAYFGDVDREDNPLAEFSTSLFDGIFKWMAIYSAAGVIPTAQTIEIPAGTDYTANPSDAFNLIKAMYDNMPDLMRLYTDSQLVYYVSPEIWRGYDDYLVAAGLGNTAYTTDVMTGRKNLSYKNVRIMQEPLWAPVLREIAGTAAYAAILTVAGNFIFATDDQYGEGEDGKTALQVWYDYEHFTWKWVMFLKVGTQIALPEHIVYAISDTSFSS